MKMQVTVRLYEDAQHNTVQPGRFIPDADQSWEVERGETIGLNETDGGRVFAVVDEADQQIHSSDAGKRYRLVTAWIQD